MQEMSELAAKLQLVKEENKRLQTQNIELKRQLSAAEQISALLALELDKLKQ